MPAARYLLKCLQSKRVAAIPMRWSRLYFVHAKSLNVSLVRSGMAGFGTRPGCTQAGCVLRPGCMCPGSTLWWLGTEPGYLQVKLGGPVLATKRKPDLSQLSVWKKPYQEKKIQ